MKKYGKTRKRNIRRKEISLLLLCLSRNHPFLVALVVESEDEGGKIYLSGFNMTRSVEMVLKDPSKFIRIDNPNPNDDAACYVCVDPIKNKPLKYFTRPIRDWELSSKDELAIDLLVEEKLSK